MDNTNKVEAAHRSDTSRSISALPAEPSATEELTTSYVFQTPDPLATTDAVIAPPTDFPPQAGQCRIEAEIGRGGMGVVLRATDTSFGRKLAVKVLRARADEHPELARRFLDEARLTGRLQHPGIPPVHEQGTLDDGRPFFTMKLIEGRTLDTLLKGRSSPQEDLPRFVTIFGQVCQTVAYAHSLGVIHRDLKPANVMVGAFGEVQVMDWGLARVRGTTVSTAAGATEANDDNAEQTQAGQALGSPAYMAPEQARGERDKLNERVDVFGLGAILCTVLTGLPPYQGKSVVEVLTQAQQGDLSGTWTRLNACEADAELIALARACLSADPCQRPRDAGEVAAATARYQDGVQERLRRAELDRAAAHAKAIEEHKRRRIERVLAVVILGALLLGSGTWLWLSLLRGAARVELGEALERSRRLMAKRNLPDAMSAARQAEGLLTATGSRAELRKQVAERIQEIEFVGRLEKIRTPESTAEERLSSRARADTRYAQAFRDLGIDVDTLDADEAARRLADRPALKPYLVEALDDWTGPRRQARSDDLEAVRRLLKVARRADPDPWRDRVRDALSRGDMLALEELAAAVEVHSQTTSALLALAEQLMYGGHRKTAVDLLRKAQWEHPEDFWLPFYQGLWHGNDNDPSGIEEGTKYYAVAVALRPHNVEAWSGYSLMLMKQGRIEEAVTASRRAVELEPDSCSAQLSLRGALTMKGDLQGATRARRRAVELLREQVRRDPGDDECWITLGIILEQEGKREEAIAANREGARQAPRNPWARHNVGTLLRRQGKPAEALPWLEEAAHLAPDSAYILATLALARTETGDGPGSEQALRKAIAIQPFYLPPYGTLAEVLGARGDKTGRDAALREGLRVCAEVLHKYPRNFRATFLTGHYLMKTGDLIESVKYTRKAIELNPADADAYANLSLGLHDLGLLDEALEASRQGTRLSEPNVLLLNNLAFDLLEKGESPDEANQAIQQALRLDPDSDLATLTLAEVLRAQGRFSESLTAYRRGHLLHSRQVVKKWPTAKWIQDAERLVERDRETSAVLKGERKPATATENLDYARVFFYKQRYTAAAEFFKTALVLDHRAADDPVAGHRSLAARCAVLAGLGYGVDSPSLEPERTAWRQQALEWLQADLALLQKQAGRDSVQQRSAVRNALNTWRTHNALIEIREGKALAVLPEAERRDWQRFWADVESLLGKLNESKSNS